MKRIAIIAARDDNSDPIADILRSMIVAGCALALVLAGPVLPF